MTASSKQSEIDDLKSEMLFLFIKNNMYEQRLRNYSTRFYNLDTRGLNNMEILFQVYEQFIYPTYEMAKADGLLGQIPPFLATLDVGHPLPTRGEGLKPPITFRFISRVLKDIFVKYSKTALSYFNKSNGLRGTNKVTCGRDLTEHNRSTLSRLYDHPDVYRGWLQGHFIKFKKYKKDSSEPDDKIYTVKNPFGISLQQMIVDVPQPRWCILYRSKRDRHDAREEEEEEIMPTPNRANNPFEVLQGDDGEGSAGMAHRGRSQKPSQSGNKDKRHSNSKDRRYSNRSPTKTQWPNTQSGAAGSDHEGYGIPAGMARRQGYGRGHGNYSNLRGRGRGFGSPRASNHSNGSYRNGY